MIPTCDRLMQVHPPIDVMKKTKLSLDKPITLPVVRNVDKLEADEELYMLADKKKKKVVEVEPIDAAPKKKTRK